MNIRHGKYAQRKAISPIIATVLIIAVTLIAAVAIGGFVFGIFGSSSASAQVGVTSQNLIATDNTSGGSTKTYVCSTTQAANNLVVTNTGTAGTTVTGVTITWAGAVNSLTNSGTAASCSVGAAGSATAVLSINIAATNTLTVNAVTGQTYTGTVTMGNGAILIFTGTFN